MGWFSKLLGGSGAQAAPQAEEPAVAYGEFRIQPQPMAEGSQFRTAGLILRDYPEGTRSVRFIRADVHGSRDAAIAHALSKGRQIIDEQGENVFSDKGFV